MPPRAWRRPVRGGANPSTSTWTRDARLEQAMIEFPTIATEPDVRVLIAIDSSKWS
jgi:hypothetical protein